MTDTRPILIVHPGAELYGSDRVLLESIDALVATGRQVVVALPVDGPLRQAIEQRGAAAVTCRMPVVRKSALRPRGAVAMLRDTAAGVRDGRRLLRRLRPSVVYVNTLTIPLWFVLARMSGIASIAHVHEAERSAPGIVRAALALPLLVADKVVANSRFSVDALGSSFRRLRGTEVLYNGVPGPIERRPARDQLDGRLDVVYVGRLSPRKGVDLVVSAVAQLREEGRDVRLALVGSVFAGYEWYEAQLRQQVADAGMAEVVAFHGFKPQVWDDIADADVLVVPSRVDEPFGNTAVEGLLAARPVIASATSGLLEATQGFSAASTFEAGSVQALAAALASIADDWPGARERAWHDSVDAEERHSPERYRHRIREIVDTVRAA